MTTQQWPDPDFSERDRATPSEPEAQKAVALWQYRWTNPGNYENQGDDALAWKEVVPQSRLQTLDSRLDELRSYQSNGKPCYEVRALGVIDPSPAASMEVQGLTEEELLEALTGHVRGYITDTVRSIAMDVQRALAAKNGWRLGGQS